MKCPNCDHNLIGDPIEQGWVRCSVCGVYFAVGIDALENASYYETGAYRDRYHLRDEEAHQTRRAENIVKYIPAASVFVDIGCSKGILMDTVRRNFPDCVAYGVDLDPRLTGEGVFRSITEVPEQADCVTLIHSLEHMPHPVAALAEVASKMQKGGYLVVEVPNGDAMHPLGYYYGGAFGHPHIVAFDMPALAWTLNRAGFSVERMLHHGDGGLRGAPSYYYLLTVARKR